MQAVALNMNEFKKINPLIDNFNLKVKPTAIPPKVIEIKTDSASVKASNEFVKLLTELKETAPIDMLSVKIKVAEKKLQSVNQSFNKLSGFLSFICQHDTDDSKVNHLIENLVKAKSLLEYLSDYLDLAIKTYYDDLNLEKEENIYTYEELMEEIF